MREPKLLYGALEHVMKHVHKSADEWSKNFTPALEMTIAVCPKNEKGEKITAWLAHAYLEGAKDGILTMSKSVLALDEETKKEEVKIE